MFPRTLNRKNGYCEEACKVVIKTIFGEGVSIELLKKIGFHRDNPKDGSLIVKQGFVDEDKKIYICPITKLVVEKDLFFTDLALNR